jgi:hypothetical protein
MIDLLVWLCMLVYGYNVWLQYRVLTEMSMGKRVALSLLRPPLNLLKFLVTWVNDKE